MKKQALQLLQWLDQVATDSAIGDFGLRIAHAIAQNARLHCLPGTTIAGVNLGLGGWLVIGNPSISYTDLAKECRATKGGVRKAVKALEASQHILCAPASSPKVPTEYTLILHPRNRERPKDDQEHAELKRLSDVYDLVADAAAPAKHRQRRYRLGVGADKPGKPFTTPEEIEGRMSSTRRAALRDARLRDRLRNGGDGSDR